MMKKWGWLLFIIMVFSVSAALAGNTIETASAIALNKDYTDHLEDSGDNVYYRFTTPADGYISVSFSNDYVDDPYGWYLTITDGSDDGDKYMEAEYAANITDVVRSANYGLPAGTYYVTVGGSYPNVSYTFRINYTQSDAWETEFNDEIASADVINVNRKYHGTVKEVNGDDYFRFTLPADGYVSISFGHAYVANDQLGWMLKLINLTRDEYVRIDYEANEEKEVNSANFGLPAGTYLVWITSNGWTDADYWFQVNYTESDAWETEFNNSIMDADPIALNKYYTGAVTDLYDDDYYKLTVPEEGELSILFSHEAVRGADDSSFWKARVIDPQENEKASASFRGDQSGEVETAKFTLEAGTYYLIIETGYDRSDIDYRFKVTFSIPKISISEAVIETIADHVYTGQAIKPAPRVTYKGEELVKGKDYKVSYAKNTDVGKAAVTVKGIGRFAGKVKVTFRILPKAVRLKSLTAGKKSLTVKWSKGMDVTGYQIEYSLKKNFSAAKKITVSKASTLKTTIGKLNAKKTYYVRIRAFKTVGGKKYYSAWSPALSKKTK